jgi:peptide/nickel transport system substrate-binding protein
VFNRQPVGSGPFRFVQWPDEGRLRLQRIRDGQAVDFIRITDPTVRVLKLLRGEVDMLQNDLPPEMLAFLASQQGISISRERGSNFTYLGFNLDDSVVGDRRVREAIAHAINRQAIIEYLLGDAARPASALLLPDHWAGNAGLPAYEYNPQRARELLREAGYDASHRLRLVYKTSSDAYRIRLATVIQRQLADVGIDVDLRSYDWGTFYGDIKAGRFQMYSLSWVGIKSPDIFRYAFHSAAVPPNGANRGRFADAEVDRLIEAAADADETGIQADLYRQLQARLLATLPYVPLWYEDHVFVARESLRGYTLGRDGDYDGLIKVEYQPGERI